MADKPEGQKFRFGAGTKVSFVAPKNLLKVIAKLHLSKQRCAQPE